jgi:hypothetical protein
MSEQSGADRLRPYLHRADPPAGPLPVPSEYGANVVDGEVVESDPYGDEPLDASLLRPYQLTGGRTAPVDPTLAIESQVVAAAGATPQTLRFEHRDVVSAVRCCACTSRSSASSWPTSRPRVTCGCYARSGPSRRIRQ